MTYERKLPGVRLFWAFSTTLFIAMVLTVLRPPHAILQYWPDWVALVILFWAIVEPERIDSWTGFASGILLEVILVVNFGVHALGLALLVFVGNRIHSQFRVFGLWQQILIVGLMVALYKLLSGWLYGLVGDFRLAINDFLPVFGSMLLWPFVSISLREIKRLVGSR